LSSPVGVLLSVFAFMLAVRLCFFGISQGKPGGAGNAAILRPEGR
jgi:hypothetical protein